MVRGEVESKFRRALRFLCEQSILRILEDKIAKIKPPITFKLKIDYIGNLTEVKMEVAQEDISRFFMTVDVYERIEKDKIVAQYNDTIKNYFEWVKECKQFKY